MNLLKKLAESKQALVKWLHCQSRGHHWEASPGSLWHEVRVCDRCGRVEQRLIRGKLEFPWRRLNCRRRA